MADSVNLSSFPSNEVEALAFLYVQQQDLTGKSPEEIHTMYQEAHYAIRKDHRKKRETGWFNAKHEELMQS